MAEEFQHAGLCAGGNFYWWNNNNDHAAVVGSLDMEEDTMKNRFRSSCDEPGDATTAFQDVQKPDSAAAAHLLQIMGLGLSSSDWNQPNHLLHGGERGEVNYNSMLQQDMASPISHQQKNQDLNCSTTSGFPMVSLSSTVTDDNNYSASTWLQNLFEPPQPDHQPSGFINNYCSMPSCATTTTTSMNQGSPCWQKLSPFLQQTLEPKQQQQVGAATGLHFSNNTPYWNASSAAALTDNIQQFVTPSFEDKPNCSNKLITTKANTHEESIATPTVKRGNSNDQLPAFKRPRIETPSPLPTFKVRKEKLGDRITALQQLVSPFGKTDTASVLHEAIEYIKFLHDQVSVLSTPYMKNGAPLQHQQVSSDHSHHKLMKEAESGASKQDLRSRGLCLVPISSTFPVANESATDFWTPTFGGTFR